MAQTLKMHRERRRLSTRELAKAAGVAADTIWRIEGGDFQNVRPMTQRKIAAALSVDPDDISEFKIMGLQPEADTIDNPEAIIALVKLPAPAGPQLAEADRRLDRGFQSGFYASNADGTPSDERISVEEGATDPVPA